MKKIQINLKVFKFILLVLAISVFSMCKNDNIKENVQSETEELGFSADSIMGMVYSVPDPDEILGEMFMDSIVLDPELVSPIKSSDQFYDSKKISLNFGVYFADMAYLMLLEKNILAIDYFKVLIEFSGNLGLSNIESQDLFTKIQNSVNNRDELLKIVKNSMYNIKDELEYTNRNKVLVLIYTGSVIESLYLAINNVNYEDTYKIKEKIMEQAFVLDNLYSFLNQYKDDPDIKLKLEQIDSIKYYMNRTKEKGTDMSVQKNEDNHLIIKGGSKSIFNINDYKSMKQKIIELRKSIVEV